MYTKIIQSVAEQLCHPLAIKDYDVACMVANNYVKMRVEDSLKECKKFHIKILRNRFGHGLLALRAGVNHHNSHELFHSMICYISSKRGIRGQYWRVSASAWGVKNLEKRNPTIKDKLDDLNYIPIKVLNECSGRM